MFSHASSPLTQPRILRCAAFPPVGAGSSLPVIALFKSPKKPVGAGPAPGSTKHALLRLQNCVFPCLVPSSSERSSSWKLTLRAAPPPSPAQFLVGPDGRTVKRFGAASPARAIRADAQAMVRVLLVRLQRSSRALLSRRPVRFPAPHIARAAGRARAVNGHVCRRLAAPHPHPTAGAAHAAPPRRPGSARPDSLARRSLAADLAGRGSTAQAAVGAASRRGRADAGAALRPGRHQRDPRRRHPRVVSAGHGCCCRRARVGGNRPAEAGKRDRTRRNDEKTIKSQ